jgi:Domain of unknown function (DUF5925)/ATPase family associated with various cellular activities (AAA)
MRVRRRGSLSHMASAGDSFRLSHDATIEQASTALFAKHVYERGVRTVRSDGWATSSRSLEGIPDGTVRVFAEWGEHRIFKYEEALVSLGVYSGHVRISVAHDDESFVDSVFRWLHERFPTPDPSSAHEITVTFWTYGPQGPAPTWRTITVPSWDEIRENYAEGTRSLLQPLMEGFQPARGGQLVLWHGLAGTGKTFALRALGWEWRDWCEFHYIVDPDSFFGQHADYLMNVLLQPAHMAMGWTGYSLGASSSVVHAVDVDGEQESEDGKGWKLLMLEDTGELLNSDARAVIGQGLSRFLNVVDGMIGQGLRILVLVTTNEEIKTLHPAVARPGRCAANVRFLPLTREESERWLSTRGSSAAVDSPTTLASLYALAEGLDPGEGIELADFAG